MSYSIIKEKNINPDFNMIDRILLKLNSIFDNYELFHHSSNSEMFEFTYQKNDLKTEAWQITFLGQTVVSGGEFGLCYDDFYEDDYLFLIQENEGIIYNKAYNGAIEYISKLLEYVSFANISREYKDNWINIINNGIEKINNN